MLALLFLLFFTIAHAAEESATPDAIIELVVAPNLPTEQHTPTSVRTVAWHQHAHQLAQQQAMHYLTHHAVHAQQQCQTLQRTELYQQQTQCAVKNYAYQKEQLQAAYIQWCETAPQRAQAYVHTMHNPQPFDREYTLSDRTKQACRKINIQINDYEGIRGNALQHVLMQEVVNALNAVSPHAPCNKHYPFQHSMYIDTLHMLDTARELNDMGLCVDAADLIDVGTTLIDYLKSIAKGLTNGAVASAKQIITGPIDLICHPIESIQSLQKTAITLARVAHHYWPPQLPDEFCTAEEYELYLQQCGRTEQHWHEAAKKVRLLWNNTSCCDFVYQTAYAAAHAATNVLVAQQCTKLLHGLVQAAKPYVTAAVKNAGKVKISATVPGYILFESQATKEIMAYAATQEFTPTYMAQALNNYVKEEAIEGCLSSLNAAIGKYHQLPGAQVAINDIFKLSFIPANSRARGSSYGFISALELEKRGHTIVAFEQKIKEYTADIITATHLVECKNVRWQEALADAEKVKRLKKQLRRASEAGYSTNKPVLLYTKYPIPPCAEAIKKLLSECNNIEVMIG